MSKLAAFRAVYADWKLIKTRGQVQIVLELPIEQADAAYEVLGGMPVAGKERWFGIAAIRNPEAIPGASDPQPDPASQPRPDRVKRDWRDIKPSQQAGIRCDDAIFRVFLQNERYDDFIASDFDPAECVRIICGVSSRSLLNTEHRARVIWKQLDDQFEAWKRVDA